MTNHEFSIELLDALSTLAISSRLMVLVDFDGTIAHFTVDPSRAATEPSACQALNTLATLPLTDVSIVSGRALGDLRERCRDLNGVRFVGSHGAEYITEQARTLTPEQSAVLERAVSTAQSLGARVPGTIIERKPFGVVLHVRGALSEAGDSIIAEFQHQLRDICVGAFIEGNRVIEYTVVSTSKGSAVERLRKEFAPLHILAIGDDVTDETAFAALSPTDFSIKVGSGPSNAKFRIDDVLQTGVLLSLLAERRAHWISSTPRTEIDHHAFLSDLRTFAILDDHASISWCCVPRLDSVPLFGSLVGGPGAGDFSIQIEGTWTQRYIDTSLMVETRCTSADMKTVSIVDFLDCSAGLAFQRAGRTDLVRIIKGDAQVQVRFAPRLDFGRIPTHVTAVPGGLRVEGGSYPIALWSPNTIWTVRHEGPHQVALAEFTPIEEHVFELRLGTRSTESPRKPVALRQQQTASFWSSWVKSLQIPSVASELVERSALVLRGLTYGPTGAIAAAATTSLPEVIGGVRNWDYRFAWPRDASLAASALLRLGAIGPGIRLLDWILAVLSECGPTEFLSPVYSVDGNRISAEAEVPEALGFRGSRPVRVGNLAGQQLQLDTLGPLARLLGDLTRAGAALTPEHLKLAERMVGLVETYWEQADHGIWEVRSPPQHFVHSKVMCWLTVTECALMSTYLGTPRPDWIALSQQIRQQVETQGYSSSLGSYTVAYNQEEADASLLWIVLAGFHDANDPRAIGTVDYVMRELLEDDALYRYRFHDGLTGSEGSFPICLSWLIEALVKMNRREEAERLFAQYRKRIGPLGLAAEEWDTKRSMALGNFPQAYSHIGIINCACALAAESGNPA